MAMDPFPPKAPPEPQPVAELHDPHHPRKIRWGVVVLDFVFLIGVGIAAQVWHWQLSGSWILLILILFAVPLVFLEDHPH